MKKIIRLLYSFVVFYRSCNAQVDSQKSKQRNSFPLSNAVIYVDDADDALVKRSAESITTGYRNGDW